jgi:hypothetical protein
MNNYTELNMEELEWHWRTNKYVELVWNIVSFQIGLLFVVLVYKFLFTKP